MEYSHIDQETLDIDWYAVDADDVLFHVASAGGKLPDTISNSLEDTQKIAKYMRQLPFKTNASLNPKLTTIKKFLDLQKEKQYSADFISIAERGIYSFDKSFLGKYDDVLYHLVAIPNESIHLKDLPPDIREIVNKTRIHKKIKEVDILSISEFQR